MTRQEFESQRNDETKKLGHDVFYINGVEVIQNPTSSDIRQVNKEVRERLPGITDAKTRFTEDNFGNRFIWAADKAIHGQLEPVIAKKIGREVSQNAEFNLSGANYKRLIFKAVSEGKDVPRHVLEQFKGQDWADAALAKMEATSAPSQPSAKTTPVIEPKTPGETAKAGEQPPPGQDVANPEATPKADHGEPKLTSARQAWINRHRERLGLSGINSKLRRTWIDAMAQAWERNLPQNALRLADKARGGEILTDVETAAMVIRMVELENEMEGLTESIARETDPAAVKSLSAEIGRARSEYDVITQANFVSGSETGRALNIRKMAINQSFTIESVKAQAKAVKGSELTERDASKLEQATKDFNEQKAKVAALEKKVTELQAQKTVKSRAGTKRWGSMSKGQLTKDRTALESRVTELLAAGCY